jgi:hypothetical protein
MTEVNAKTDIGRRGLVIGAVAAGTLGTTQMAVSTARAKVAANLGLFEGINREKNPNSMTTLEKLHIPDFSALTTVKKGESASVAVRARSEAQILDVGRLQNVH